jgi:hypothetical protein
MPFRHENTTGFGPDDLALFHEVFELAWQRLIADGLTGDSRQLEEVRRRLASCIMANATPGHLKKDDLVERCIKSFMQRATVG